MTQNGLAFSAPALTQRTHLVDLDPKEKDQSLGEEIAEEKAKRREGNQKATR